MRFKVVKRRSDGFLGESWGARCVCGAWLTKYDHDEEEARRGAIDVLAKGPYYHFAHVCPKNVWDMPVQESLLDTPA